MRYWFFSQGFFCYSVSTTLNLHYSIYHKSTCAKLPHWGQAGLQFFNDTLFPVCYVEYRVWCRTSWSGIASFSPPINTRRYLHTALFLLFLCCDVIYFNDLPIPVSCVKVQQHSVTELDWAVNLPYRSAQTHSLCQRYPQAAAISFPPFPREHWQVKGLDKSYISLSLQIHEGVLLDLSLSRSRLTSLDFFNKERMRLH